jgi:hypothetical protein
MLGTKRTDDPQVCRAYRTEDGLMYYVLSITFDRAQMLMKYLVLSNEEVPTHQRKHMMDVGEIGDFTGPCNLSWMDERIF